jgi:[protein-PII] uridylyltransferase
VPRLSAAWARLREDRELRGKDWSRAARDLADAWLRALFEQALVPSKAAQAPKGWRERRRARPVEQAGTGVALLAVGSLGRGDLAPGSDLDLLLVHDGRPDIVEMADRLWYPIWDDPMPLDHSVRTLSQVERAAESDLRVAQGLLDARPVAGDMALATGTVALARRLWQKRVGRWLPEVLETRRGAQQVHGEVAFLLEPDLKECCGGLRDLQLLALMATVTPVVGAVVADERLAPAGERLHAVRVELQRPDGRRSERLTIEDQDRVAEGLGLPSREVLAHEVAHAGRAVAWLTEDAWRRVGSWLAGPRGRAGSADRALGQGLVLRDNEVTLPAGTAIGEDASLALRAAETSAQLGVPLARSTMARMSQEAPSPPHPWPAEVTRALVSLLSCGGPAIHAIETLDQLGVWERYLPEWPAVRNRPQFNPYHRWTVDRHLLETVANAAEHVRDVSRPDLLMLGALLHDIGKGSPGDHSSAGASISAEVSRRLGLPTEDAAVLTRVVEHHLLLPDTATRRDLEDPATAVAVAEAVGDETTLELLAALAAADGAATGPSAWNPWRAGLVDELVLRTSAVLAGKPAPKGAPFPSEEHRGLMAMGGFQALPGDRDLVIVAPDRPGLLSDVTGALALNGVSVLEARVHSEAGVALEVFVLDLSNDAHPRWEQVVTDIERAARRELDIGNALARRPPTRAERRALRFGGTDVRVIVHNDASARATVVEVRAPDAPGVLHRITAAIAGQGLDIISARVATLGNAVVDSFYLQAGGAKLATDEQAGALVSAIEASLAAPPNS